MRNTDRLDARLSVIYSDSIMQSGPFIKLIAHTFGLEDKTVAVFARALREAGLLTTGARGVNAPHMTPLDAARMTLAVLTTDSPSECVERVRRFGSVKYSPDFRKSFRGYETIQPEKFHQIFGGTTLEEVLAYVFSLPASLGMEKACEWHELNVFHLRISDFEVLAELYRWKMDGHEIVGEEVVPFKGQVWERHGEGVRPVEGFTVIKGGIRTERSIVAIDFLAIGIGLTL